jgi:hypothetical protein
MTNEFASSIDRRGFLRLGVCVGMLAVVGCGPEDAGTIQPNPSSGNKSRLEKRKLLVKPGPAAKGAEAPEKKADDTPPKSTDEAPAKKE